MDEEKLEQGRKVGKDTGLYEYVSTMPAREGIQYYFRAVTKQEFDGLVNDGYMPIGESYQGITDNFSYVTQPTYYGAGLEKQPKSKPRQNSKHNSKQEVPKTSRQNQYVIEFEIDKGISLPDVLQKGNVRGKGESSPDNKEAISYGLGEKATPFVPSNQKTTGGTYFKNLMIENNIRWRVVKCISKESPVTWKG